jgi:DNA polymerase III epsilon subunit-like protein
VKRLCFIDTETTSLRHDRRAWEIGLIVREPGKDDAEYSWFVAGNDLDLGNADLASLNIGRFHERHPMFRGDGYADCWDERAVMEAVEGLTRGAHLIGAVVNFDADVLSARMRAHGICPSWHYHLCCVENLAAGWLHRHAAALENRAETIEEATQLRDTARPPWHSEDLSRAVNVEPGKFDRHTALGDAQWARAIYDAVTGMVS